MIEYDDDNTDDTEEDKDTLLDYLTGQTIDDDN